MIISASYRTDIPTFYGEWFRNRLRAGYCKMVNPYNQRVVTVSLRREDVVELGAQRLDLADHGEAEVEYAVEHAFLTPSQAPTRLDHDLPQLLAGHDPVAIDVDVVEPGAEVEVTPHLVLCEHAIAIEVERAERRHSRRVERKQPLWHLVLRGGHCRLRHVRGETRQAAGLGASEVPAYATLIGGAVVLAALVGNELAACADPRFVYNPSSSFSVTRISG